jgi:hypothetical protein
MRSGAEVAHSINSNAMPRMPKVFSCNIGSHTPRPNSFATTAKLAKTSRGSGQKRALQAGALLHLLIYCAFNLLILIY